MVHRYSAYFDASGHPDEGKVITVAGFASSVAKWKRFEIGWEAILKRHKVTAFHMTDFASSGGEFEDWKGKSTKRREFVSELTACIKGNVNKACRTSLILEDYNRVNAIYKLEETLGRPYAVCGILCIYGVRQWAKRKKVSSVTQCFFEDGDKDRGNMETKAKQAFPPNLWPVFLPKEKASAFQTCDFAGWKYRTSITNALADDHTLEKGFRLLDSLTELRGIPQKNSAGVLNSDSLIGYCEIFHVPRR